MSLKIAEVLNKDVLSEILDEHVPVEDVVEKLFMKGYELSEVVPAKLYESWAQFKEKHVAGQTELVALEGESTFEDGDVVVLLGCPMVDTMKQLNIDGAPPTFHARIVEDYKAQNPGANAILHPGCIAHQVARQLIIKNISFEDGTTLNFYQLACRSGATGKVVYDDNGLEAIGMSKEQANTLIADKACLYVIVRNR